MTDADPPSAEPGDQLREEAAAWFARMRGDDAADHQAAFDAWLARGAAHRAAYNRIGEMFAEAKVLKDHEALDQSMEAPRRRAGMPMIAIALAGAVALGSIVNLTLRDGPNRPVQPPVREAAANAYGIRTMVLPRGDRAILDAGATVVPAVAGDIALSRLEAGRARFIIVSAKPPLQILAGNLAFRSEGGTVDLWLRPDGSIDAQPIEGNVQVAPAVWRGTVANPRYARLLVGQHYVIDSARRIDRRPRVAGTDWPNGVLEYRGVPLREVVEEANRYSPVKIVVAEASLGERRVSGRFRVNDPLVLAQRLASALSLDLDQSQAGRLLLLPPQK